MDQAEFSRQRNNDQVSTSRWVDKVMKELHASGKSNAAETRAVLGLVKGAAAMASRHADWTLDEEEAMTILLGASHFAGRWAEQRSKSATQSFIQHAEELLAKTDSDLTEDERYKLVATVDRMRAGEESVGTADTVDGWLERLRDHFP